MPASFSPSPLQLIGCYPANYQNSFAPTTTGATLTLVGALATMKHCVEKPVVRDRNCFPELIHGAKKEPSEPLSAKE
jgi:hypothetical protein